ncbi:MAG: HD domain-containing protein, partial [Anaerolineales bacterium]|nr:HD domain-containing protein [Anaerolineales bacterium]
VRRTTKDGRPYMLCTLGDKTGQIGGVFWDLPPELDRWLEAGLVVYVTGRVNKFKDALQVNISDLYPEQNPDLSHYLPSSPRPQEEAVTELKELIASLSEPWQGLVSLILLEQPFYQQYINAPAAKSMHHAYVGGLLDHSLSMARLADFLAAHYPHVRRDLLIAGALLHDLGKVWDYEFTGAFAISDDGRLVGHITRAAIEIEKAADAYGEIGADDLRDLTHLILSHHGTLEWGSPIVPKTLEAVLLHQVDLLDSRVQGYYDHLRNDPGDNEWTNKASPMHSTRLRRPPTWDKEPVDD